MAITHQIRLPCQFYFRLRNRASGKIESAPTALCGYDWRVWGYPMPDGIEYEVIEPEGKIIRWDGAIWAPDSDVWTAGNIAWQVHGVA